MILNHQNNIRNEFSSQTKRILQSKSNKKRGITLVQRYNLLKIFFFCKFDLEIDLLTVKKVLAVTQVRSTEHLRLDPVFLYTDGHATALQYTVKPVHTGMPWGLSFIPV